MYTYIIRHTDMYHMYTCIDRHTGMYLMYTRIDRHTDRYHRYACMHTVCESRKETIWEEDGEEYGGRRRG